MSDPIAPAGVELLITATVDAIAVPIGHALDRVVTLLEQLQARIDVLELEQLHRQQANGPDADPS